ncbi:MULTISPECIES: AMP-binding protein [Streptomyces]|uniref:AMP-binding protein n=1 Tax=Streptomyces TaxID=1883 RepID=UPI00163B8454|nr:MULTISPECIES: AMP-binding protein [Streptomyces]MBC2879743.1 AMP-binding protein [Streptomyces sp. TYQ1024]UBI40908.1 AMP-binding protein [Streptomyces mobaraensis]UKW33390.1 AMP-binding protein [Streptomyces sp. TYQ1024]
MRDHRPDSLVHTLLDEAVAFSPSAAAVADAEGRWDYARLDAYSRAFTDWLAARGVGPGDRLVVQLPTTRELTALFYGASRRGAVFVPLNPHMKPYHLRSVLENAEPALVVCAEGDRATFEAVTGAPVHEFGGVWSETEKTADRGPRPEAAVDVAPEDPAVLVYTSGSTAAPKAVVCPHAQMVFATRSMVQVLGYRPDDVVFCRFPMSWDYGLYKVLMCAAGRSGIVLADGESDLRLLTAVRESGATVVPIVPSLAAMIATLARREENPAPRVRMFTNTGAALPQPVIETLRAAFPGARVVRQFGQTECKRVSIMPPEEDRERPDSVGRPLPGTRVLVVDEDGASVPVGETGEIVAVGPHVMPGYWRNPEVTARTFRRHAPTGELRLHTGDYGSLDADGYLYFQGRRDDMFKRKGIRMSTLEIEAAAMDVPGVRAAAVLPPSDRHDLALFVESDLAPHVVLRELAGRLEQQKVPAVCRVLAEWPLTLHGKNEKRRLAELLDGSDQ